MNRNLEEFSALVSLAESGQRLARDADKIRRMGGEIEPLEGVTEP